jgi:hypothetical protein
MLRLARGLPASLSLIPALALSVCLGGCSSPEGRSEGDGFETGGTTTADSGSEASTSADSSDSADGPTDTGDGDTTGDGDGDEGTYCVHHCEGDEDCLIDGVDNGYECIDQLCTAELASSCTTDEGCVAYLSGWTAGTPCTPGGGECDAAMQVCLEIEGAGHCAVAPNDFLTCDTLQMDEIPVVDIDGSDAIVCGRTNAACHEDGYCWLPCQDDGDCASEAYPHCNAGTGVCECTSDAGCDTLGYPEYSVCNAGVCGCDSDQQCSSSGAGDVCNPSGVCGCSGDAACESLTNPYDGGMYVCQ